MARLLRTALLLLLVLHGAALAQAQPVDTGALGPAQLAIVVNDADPASVAVAAYYRERRGIPAANVVHVRIPGKPHSLEPARFRLLKAEIDSQLGPGIQAVLMVWTAPYAVACNSITAAYTLGFDAALCRDTCAAGQPSAYFNAPSVNAPGRGPFASHGMRLAMLLPTESVAAAKSLIDRGVTSGFRPVPASAYYLTTSEASRNSRAAFFPPAGRIEAKKLDIRRLQAEALENANDIMFYQLGKASVDKLDTLHFLPGALADHLTSYGGELLGSRQMSSLRWLDAGATASYGTVSEPCSHWQKFPNPAVLLRHYLRGDSAIEAYWKSVAWPAQGLFIGEPLAAPYRRR